MRRSTSPSAAIQIIHEVPLLKDFSQSLNMCCEETDSYSLEEYSSLININDQTSDSSM